MNRRIAFIIPYFGKFNNYFQLFLETCGFNSDLCDWLIFTDDYTNYKYPENVMVHYMTWDEMEALIRSKIDCPVVIERPYKLCDYKPAYGYLFSEYLKDYEFWGECDCDLIWGDISCFLTSELLDNYDKIFDLAHCTIYRNNEQINTLFMKKLKGKFRYIEVYGSDTNFSFDEEYRDSINNIAIEHGMKLFEKSFAANTYTKSSNFRLTRLAEDKNHYQTEKKSDSVFIWEKGRLYRYLAEGTKLRREEYMYMHFQSRPMEVKTDMEGVSVFKIIPNSFDSLEVKNINSETFRKIKKKHFNLHYFKLRSKNLKRKIIRFVNNGRKNINR